jgi:hypothetical protein
MLLANLLIDKVAHAIAYPSSKEKVILFYTESEYKYGYAFTINSLIDMIFKISSYCCY